MDKRDHREHSYSSRKRYRGSSKYDDDRDEVYDDRSRYDDKYSPRKKKRRYYSDDDRDVSRRSRSRYDRHHRSKRRYSERRHRDYPSEDYSDNDRRHHRRRSERRSHRSTSRRSSSRHRHHSRHRRDYSKSPEHVFRTYAKYRENELKRREEKQEDQQSEEKTSNEKVHEDDIKFNEKKRRTVFIQNLPSDTNEDRIKEFFQETGNVNQVKLIRDKYTNKCKGFGYVEFNDKSSVEKAIVRSGAMVDGVKITIRPSEAEKNAVYGSINVAGAVTKLFVKNIPVELDEIDIKFLFGSIGEVVNVGLKIDEEESASKQGFITFKRAEDAKKALLKVNGINIAGNSIKVGMWNEEKSKRFDNESKKLVYNEINEEINELPKNNIQSTTIEEPKLVEIGIQKNFVLHNMFDPATEKNENFDVELKEDVLPECEQFGKVLHLHVDKKSKGDIYVRFELEEASKKAFELLNNRWFCKRKIKAEYITDKEYYRRFPQLLIEED